MASVYKRGGKGNYWIAFRDADGRRRFQSSKTRDKRTAERIASKLEADAQLRIDGVIDVRADRYAIEARKPLAEHIGDYRKACAEAGQARHTIETKCRAIESIAGKIKAETLSALKADEVAHAIASMTVRHRDGLEDDGTQRWRTAPASARTKNAARGAILAFANWLRKVGRMDTHPFDHLPRADESRDRHKVRRALTDDELSRLLAVARERDAELNADPKYPHGRSARAAWYLGAALAGLRRGDLTRLTWGAVDFDAGSLTIRDGKARREDVVPMHPDLAAELRAIRPDIAPPTAKVFPTAVTNRTRTLDFERAGIKPDEQGRVADLHALRTTLGTNLARAGVAPQVAQRIMRHGNYRTTMQHYTILGLADTAGAIGRLPGIRLSEAVATGTDDRKGVAQTSTGVPRKPANRCASTRERRADHGAPQKRQAPRGAGLGASLRFDAKVEPIGIEPTTSCMPCKRSPN